MTVKWVGNRRIEIPDVETEVKVRLTPVKTQKQDLPLDTEDSTQQIEKE
jgi:hypothetical protein